MPNLGISRPYIFDLLPGGSFVEHMTREGFDFYLLDWGVFGPEDNTLSLEDCVPKILPRSATARPIPREPPVTSAVRPWSFMRALLRPRWDAHCSTADVVGFDARC